MYDDRKKKERLKKKERAFTDNKKNELEVSNLQKKEKEKKKKKARVDIQRKKRPKSNIFLKSSNPLVFFPPLPSFLSLLKNQNKFDTIIVQFPIYVFFSHTQTQ
mmetsp:Transcript_25458/g.29074  ORF Transcript_25458/g.29074 Transcript_25458/m.29074 type:complete len:104 (-) Transcript_25458:85-396(-)